MYYRVFLVSALLCCCAGKSSVRVPSLKVLAFAGEDVILPCSFNISANGDFPTVEWSKEGLKPNVIFLYRDGCETHEMKNPAFEFRTSFIPKELKNGNVSLRISNGQLADAGIYQCMQLWKNAPREITTVELVVGAVSAPRLSVLSAETEGVTLECEADYSLAEPEVKFLDDQGNDIPTEDPKKGARGCCTVRRRVTLQTTAKRVTCRIQAGINLVRAAEILISADCMKSCLLTAGISTVGAILVLGVLCGLVVCFWKTCCKCADTEKLSEPRGEQHDRQSLLQQSVMVNNSTIKKLEREVAYLKSELHKKDETIRQLQNKLESQPSQTVCHLSQPLTVCGPSTPSHVVPKPIIPHFSCSPVTSHLDRDDTLKPLVSSSSPPQSAIFAQNSPKHGIQRQNGNPAQDHFFKRKQRNHSCPALLSSEEAVSFASSSASVSEEKVENFDRSASKPYGQSGHNRTKPQRRHTSVFPSSSLHNNHYTTLVQVKEES